MSAGDQSYSRAAHFKCLSDPTVPLSVWIVPITAARPCTRFAQNRGIGGHSHRFREVGPMPLRVSETLTVVSLNIYLLFSMASIRF